MLTAGAGASADLLTSGGFYARNAGPARSTGEEHRCMRRRRGLPRIKRDTEPLGIADTVAAAGASPTPKIITVMATTHTLTLTTAKRDDTTIFRTKFANALPSGQNLRHTPFRCGGSGFTVGGIPPHAPPLSTQPAFIQNARFLC